LGKVPVHIVSELVAGTGWIAPDPAHNDNYEVTMMICVVERAALHLPDASGLSPPWRGCGWSRYLDILEVVKVP
jgi:hypothetical protein